MPRRIPLVRPPQLAQGGGAAPAFGGSGAPGLPQPGTERARQLAIQVSDDERGRFTERVFEFPQFAPIGPGGVPGAQTQIVEFVGNRTSFLRIVAIRGTLQNTSVLPLTGLELANLMLRLSINGEEDLTTSGTLTSPSSFAALFSGISAPWFWFAAPPRVRIGETAQAIVFNNFPIGVGSPTLTPEVTMRCVDDEWWQELYGT